MLSRICDNATHTNNALLSCVKALHSALNGSVRPGSTRSLLFSATHSHTARRLTKQGGATATLPHHYGLPLKSLINPNQESLHATAFGEVNFC
jgi:hypothetical protein